MKIWILRPVGGAEGSYRLVMGAETEAQARELCANDDTNDPGGPSMWLDARQSTCEVSHGRKLAWDGPPSFY